MLKRTDRHLVELFGRGTAAMIKHIRPEMGHLTGEEWRNLDDAVKVELTSEDPEWPIEHALVPHDTNGWRAPALSGLRRSV